MSKMIQCKTCSKEIATNAKSCPGCGAKNKKPMYKRAWLGALAIVIVAGTVGCSDVDNSKEVNGGNVETVQEVSQNNSENTIAENKSEDKIDNNVPMEYRSVMEKAKFYSDVLNMSKARMYEELTAGCGFTAEEAQYAVDNIEVDWKENALKDAEFYHQYMSMSPGEIYDQLTSEFGGQYTPEEAQYAIDNLK